MRLGAYSRDLYLSLPTRQARELRLARLREAAYQPVLIPCELAPELRTPPTLIALEAVLQRLLGLPHLVVLTSPQAAAPLLFQAWPKRDGDVIHNPLSSQLLFHLVDSDFNALPLASQNLAGADQLPYLTDLASAPLMARLNQAPAPTMVLIEPAGPAQGSQVLALDQLRALKQRLEPLGVPLVVEAAHLFDLPPATHEAFPGTCVDALLGGLGPEFPFGFIATHDPLLARTARQLAHYHGHAFADRPSPCDLTALADLAHLARARASATAALHRELAALGLPLLQPISGLPPLLDTTRLAAAEGHDHPAAALAAALYAVVGLRAETVALHAPARHQLLRLALPLGLEDAHYDDLKRAIVAFFQQLRQLPRLTLIDTDQTPARYAVAGAFPEWPLETAPDQPAELAAPVHLDTPVAPSQGRFPADDRQPHSPAQGTASDQRIAVIGMACRAPGADDYEQLFANLLEGRTFIGMIPASRWSASHFRAADGSDRFGALLDQPYAFDSLFFGISPGEAEAMDPQQRVLFETVWHTFEDAGIPPASLAGSRTAVYIGVGTADYRDLTFRVGAAIDGFGAAGISHCLMVNRLSFYFNLTGHSEPIDAACASSALAIQRAVRALRDGEADLALAGGVNLMLSPLTNTAIGQFGVLSGDGSCRPFCADAAGFVRGEGVACLLLKPLAVAERDGDRIHAVILGAAANHSGRTATMMAPSLAAQTKVIIDAYADAAIEAASVSYVEAAANASISGDPVEWDSLRAAAARLPGATPVSWQVGSLKAQLGHLEAVSGTMAAIKLICAMKHRQLPAIALGPLNPALALEGGATRFCQGGPWLSEPGRRLRAGLDSFGLGGVNVHLLFEEYLAPAVAASPDRADLFLLSARNEERLRAYASQVADWLAQRPGRPLEPPSARGHGRTLSRLGLRQRGPGQEPERLCRRSPRGRHRPRQR